MICEPILGSAPAHAQDAVTGATVYYKGGILSMEGDEPTYIETLVVKDDKIAFTGSKAEATSFAGDGATEVDLQGKTLLLGFVDAHGHVYNSGFQKLSANLLPPPDGECKDLASLIEITKEWAGRNANAIKKAGWIIGFGYDDSQLAEQRHPTADELDKISTDLPVVVLHQSLHLAAFNHKALEFAKYTAEKPNPSGGVIRRGADGKTPTGVLEEMAVFAPLFAILAGLDAEANEHIALAGIKSYVQYGFTTAQEGRSAAGASETWRKLGKEGRLDIDVAVYPDLQAEQGLHGKERRKCDIRQPFRIAGVKPASTVRLKAKPHG